MPTGRFSEIAITGLACAVPETIRRLADESAFGHDELARVEKNTGVAARRVAVNLCTSDLCAVAAEALFERTGCTPDSIDTVIVVTQTPDFVLPATACSLHERLSLPKSAAAFDVNLGCSGYVYGLWLAHCLIGAGSAERVLLLAGDTISRTVSDRDRSVALLFGDAASATLVEQKGGAADATFVLGSDGKGQRNLLIPAGGFRNPKTGATSCREQDQKGNERSAEDLYMDGAEIFAFTLAEVPPLFAALERASGHPIANVDAVVMHQASRFMLRHLGKKLGIPEEKLVIALRDYGNTSSASIPLAIATMMRERLSESPQRLMLAGFGVGYSWGAAALTVGPFSIPEICIVPEPVNT